MRRAKIQPNSKDLERWFGEIRTDTHMTTKPCIVSHYNLPTVFVRHTLILSSVAK